MKPQKYDVHEQQQLPKRISRLNDLTANLLAKLK